MKNSLRRISCVLSACALVLVAATQAAAAQLAIAWDANTESDIAGYLVEWGTGSAPYANTVDVGNVTAWTLPGAAEGTTYSFRVVAYNAAGERSDPSTAVTGTVTAGGTAAAPAPAPSPAPSPSPAPTNNPPVNPAASRPTMSVDLPADNSTVPPTFAVAGWAIDKGAPSTSGVDIVQVWAYPNPGSNAPAVFLGSAEYGSDRADLAPYVGTQFTPSGYALQVQGLAAGTYDLAVFAHSRIADAFNNVRTVRVTVAVPASHPLMAIDGPTPGGLVKTDFSIGGWAVDTASTSGSGIDAVHVWAYPTSGAAPIFVGEAQLGGVRPDVAAFAGRNFDKSGFNLTGKLPVGDYTLTIFSHSTVTGTFNNVMPVPIAVR